MKTRFEVIEIICEYAENNEASTILLRIFGVFDTVQHMMASCIVNAFARQQEKYSYLQKPSVKQSAVTCVNNFLSMLLQVNEPSYDVHTHMLNVVQSTSDVLKEIVDKDDR